MPPPFDPTAVADLPQVRSGRAPAQAAEWALIVAFLGIIVTVPLVQLGLELRRGERPKALDIAQRRPTASNLRAYESGLESASVPAARLRPWVQFAQFFWLKDGGEKALVGRNGWLFYRPGWEAMVNRPYFSKTQPTNDPLPAIVAFRDALAARGIRLLVMPVPNKESVYPDALTSRAPIGEVIPNPETQKLLTRLRAAQVEAVDLLAVFAQAREQAPPELLYLQQDSHWSPAGLKLAAKAVATRLLGAGWLEAGSVAYAEKAITLTRHGDVLRMLQVPQLEQWVAPEKMVCGQIIHPATRRPYEDDSRAKVLLLGDSFMRIFQLDEPGAAGFIAHLAKELGQPVMSLVSDGGASTLVRQELYRRSALLEDKKVVIWEFVERDIRLGAEGWQIIPLARQREPLPQ